jgi:hypothetical protein
LGYYRELAQLVVQEYENHVRLGKLADADNEEYALEFEEPALITLGL